MKWVIIDGVHYNTDLIISFFWEHGLLWMEVVGGDRGITITDKDKQLYHRLCDQLGIEEADGNA